MSNQEERQSYQGDYQYKGRKREAGIIRSLRRIQYCPRKACDNAFIFLIEPPILEDLEPPYNTPFQERVTNQRIAFPCPAKGVYYSVTWALA